MELNKLRSVGNQQPEPFSAVELRHQNSNLYEETPGLNPESVLPTTMKSEADDSNAQTPKSPNNLAHRGAHRPMSYDTTSREKKRNTEVFLTRVRVNALKNEIMAKQGKKPLTLEQRRQIEEKVQQEVLEFQFNQKMPDKYDPNEIVQEYIEEDNHEGESEEGK